MFEHWEVEQVFKRIGKELPVEVPRSEDDSYLFSTLKTLHQQVFHL